MSLIDSNLTMPRKQGDYWVFAQLIVRRFTTEEAALKAHGELLLDSVLGELNK